MSRPRIPKPIPGRLDEAGIVEAFAHRMMYSVAKDEHTAGPIDVHHALAYAVRDRLMERWFKTQNAYYVADAKRVYYLSLEFLLGRALVSNIANLGARGAYTQALRSLGFDLEALHEESGTRGSATAAWAASPLASRSRRRPWGFPSTATASTTSTASSRA